MRPILWSAATCRRFPSRQASRRHDEPDGGTQRAPPPHVLVKCEARLLPCGDSAPSGLPSFVSTGRLLGKKAATSRRTPKGAPNSKPPSPTIDGRYNGVIMAIIEIEGLAKSYRVYQKKEGLAAALRGCFAGIPPGRGGSRHRPDGRSRASSWPFSGPNGAGKDHHAQAALRRASRPPAARPA